MSENIFSLIIPTYNRAEQIGKTIQSVLDQSLLNFEVIVVDDGSKDNTEEIVKSFKDHRIRFYKKENEERAVARNYGIAKAKGAYITFLDSDDQLYSHALGEALNLIKIFNEPEWLHLAYEIKDEAGNILRKENKRIGEINTSLTTGNHLSCIGIFIRKDIVFKHQFIEDLDIVGSEDYLLWLKMASLFPLRYSNHVSACMIQHSGRSVVNFNKKQLISRIEKSIEYALKDSSISKFLNGAIPKFKAHRYLYLANHLSRGSHKIVSIKYYFRSILGFPQILLHRNSFSYLKSLFYRKARI